MHRKFLLFSWLVLLTSVIYFIYTFFFELRTRNEQQQEIAHVPEENSVKYVPRNSFSKAEREQTSPAATEETGDEGEIPGQVSQESFEDTEYKEIYSAPEIETDDSEINSELEMLFIVVNELWNKNVSHADAIRPFMREYAKLSKIEGELNLAINGTSGEENQRLHDKLLQVQSDKEHLADLMAPLDEEREQVAQEVEQYLATNYGTTIKGFFDTYKEEFHSWREAQ